MTQKKIIITILVFIVGAVAAWAIVRAGVREVERNQSIESEIKELQQEAQKYAHENSDLESKISYFMTPEFQEREAKEKLNLQKPGEKVIVIKSYPEENSIQGPQEVSGNKESNEKTPNHVLWWETFFGRN